MARSDPALLGWDTELMRPAPDAPQTLKSIQLAMPDGRDWLTEVGVDAPSGLEAVRAFLDRVRDYARAVRTKNITLATFNLTFDFSWVLAHLGGLGCVWRKLEEGERLASGQWESQETPNKVFSARINWGGTLIEMLDTANICTGSNLRDTARAMAGTQKHSLEPLFGPEPYTAEERAYACADARATLEIAQTLDGLGWSRVTPWGQIKRRLTIGSWALSVFRDMAGGDLDAHFEVSPDDKARIEEALRWSLRGGLCRAMAPPYEIEAGPQGINHYDVHSMYPAMMLEELPYGPILDSPPAGPCIEMVAPYCEMRIRAEWWHAAPLHFTGAAKCMRYRLDEDLKPHEGARAVFLDSSLWFLRGEFEILSQFYDIKPLGEPLRLWFRARRDPVMRTYIDTQFGAKEASPKGSPGYMMAKYLMNTLYGKTIENPEKTGVAYESYNMLDGSKSYERRQVPQTVPASAVYLPAGMVIASRARIKLMEAWLAVGPSNALYSDTDSLICRGCLPSRMVGPNLGQWGHEGSYSAVWIYGPKRYQTRTRDGCESYTCAGLKTRRWTGSGYEPYHNVPWGGLVQGRTYVQPKARRGPDLAIRIDEEPFVAGTKVLYRS